MLISFCIIYIYYPSLSRNLFRGSAKSVISNIQNIMHKHNTNVARDIIYMFLIYFFFINTFCFCSLSELTNWRCCKMKLLHRAFTRSRRIGGFHERRGCSVTLTHSGKFVNALREDCYGRLDPFSGLLKGSRTCSNQSFLHGSLVKVRRRMPFRD